VNTAGAPAGVTGRIDNRAPLGRRAGISDMAQAIQVDVWVRGTTTAATHAVPGVPVDAAAWTDDDVSALLTGMLLALEKERNPHGAPPAVSLRGFSWIVSPFDGGVVVHLEMQLGSASAGPFAVDSDRLTEAITRVLDAASSPTPPSTTVH
jgi:hypothetical protein